MRVNSESVSNEIDESMMNKEFEHDEEWKYLIQSQNRMNFVFDESRTKTN
jgi:hypothetical protein